MSARQQILGFRDFLHSTVSLAFRDSFGFTFLESVVRDIVFLNFLSSHFRATKILFHVLNKHFLDILDDA